MQLRLPVFLRRRNALIGFALLVLVVLAALVGWLAPPFDPLVTQMGQRMLPPGAEHLLGTDKFGRDIFSRLLVAAGISLVTAFSVVAMAVSTGTLIGALAGYLGGWVDHVATTVADAMLAFPGILLALGILAVASSDIGGVAFALGLAYAPSVFRLVRGQVLSIRQREYVEASTVIGNGTLFTVLAHVIPNCLSPLIVMATAMFGQAILDESALSFLGSGVAPPIPTWGGMLAEGRSALETAPWLCVFPGLAVTAAVLGANLFGDALRDLFDPRMNRV